MAPWHLNRPETEIGLARDQPEVASSERLQSSDARWTWHQSVFALTNAMVTSVRTSPSTDCLSLSHTTSEEYVDASNHQGSPDEYPGVGDFVRQQEEH